MLWQLWEEFTPEEQAVSVSFGNLPDASVLIWKAREMVAFEAMV